MCNNEIDMSKLQTLNKKWIIIFILVAFSILVLLVTSLAQTGKKVPRKTFFIAEGVEYVSDRLLVEFVEGKSPEVIKQKFNNIGVIGHKKLFNGDDAQLKNFYILEFKKGTDLEKVGNIIIDYEEIKSVEVDVIVKATKLPNDQYYAQQWHYKKIGLEEAWDKTTGGKAIIAAILDTGVDYNHPDLPRDIIKGPDFTSADGDPIDRQGHGTHVSGTVGALTNNSTGVSGINWDVRLMAVQVLGDNGSGPSSGISRGIEWAAKNGAKVINMSLGGRGPCASVYQNAVNYARSQGTVVVVAAGNDGTDAGAFTPASCNGVITVGATDQNDRRASFSNYGSKVEIGAPGTTIVSTYKGGGYKSLQGTSMASPHVAGAVALLLSQKSLTPDQVLDCLVRNGDPIDTSLGGKRLNMKKILDDPACGGVTVTNTPVPTATTTPPPGSTPTLTPRPSATLTVTPQPTATVTQIPPTPTQRPRRLVVRFRCFVFSDANKNGQADAGEKGVSGAEFTIFPKRMYSPTATTSSDGYCYLIIVPGHYRIIVRIGGKVAALSDPFEITEDQNEQTLSIGIHDGEDQQPIVPTNVPPGPVGSAYECRQPSVSSSSKALQLVNLQCVPK